MIIVRTVLIVAAILLVVGILMSMIRIVSQANAYVIERLGAYYATWHTGVHFKIPFIDRVANKVTLKEIVKDFEPQPVITKDNVTMMIDTVVYFQITDPKLYTYGVVGPITAIENLNLSGEEHKVLLLCRDIFLVGVYTAQRFLFAMSEICLSLRCDISYTSTTSE